MTVAEEEGEQAEEQPQSQSGDLGSGLISLDQARAIALDQARGNQDFYGRRYRRQDLVWNVVNQEEREDAYRIRITYQPARGFRGEAGVEEFTIDRQGSVQSRRIVSEPVRRGGFLGCGLLAAGVVSLSVLVLAMGVLASVM